MKLPISLGAVVVAGLSLLSLFTGCRTNRVSPQSSDILTLAEGYLVLNEPHVARSYYMEILKKDPNNGQAFLGRARAALKLGDYKTALKELNHAEQGDSLSRAERQSLQILFGRTFQRIKKPPFIVWSYLYPIWQQGDLAVKSCLDAELKALAKRLPNGSEGVEEVLGFVARIPKPPVSPTLIPQPQPLPRQYQPPSILRRSAWRPPLSPRMHKINPMGRPYRITVHHSDHDFPGHSLRKAAYTIQGIQKYHIQRQGWGDIGYHYIIDTNGRIWTARSVKFQGAHAGGTNNRGNIGICLLGNYDRHPPNRVQKNNLTWLIQWLRRRYSIPRRELYGHCDFKVTNCPGRHLLSFVKSLRR